MEQTELKNKEMIRRAIREHLGVTDEKAIDAREINLLRGLLN